jgi:hypothetical protein
MSTVRGALQAGVSIIRAAPQLMGESDAKKLALAVALCCCLICSPSHVSSAYYDPFPIRSGQLRTRSSATATVVRIGTGIYAACFLDNFTCDESALDVCCAPPDKKPESELNLD